MSNINYEGIIAKLELPLFQVLETVKVKFRENDEFFIATVRAVHIYRKAFKYDLALWLGDGSIDNPETETRIYNVDSKFITAYN